MDLAVRNLSGVERENKRRILKDQIARSSAHLNKTTGLIQFCIEILKETDPVAYLQVYKQMFKTLMPCLFR